MRLASLLLLLPPALAAAGASDLVAQRPPDAPAPSTIDANRRVVVRAGDRDPVTRSRRGRGEIDRPATPAEMASAYIDARSRDIVSRARVARTRQDSSIRSYDATVKQRMSAGLNVKAVGRDRLLFRSELAARVRWARPNRVAIDILAARTAAPTSFKGARALTGIAELVPIPHFSGSESMMWWHNLGGDEEDWRDDDDNPFAFVHPLEEGAEAFYRYEAGDSAIIRMPGGREIVLRELRVHAREKWDDLIAGSLWFETARGQLVRAVFRPAVPIDMKRAIDEDFEDVPAPVRATLLTPFEFDIESFSIEYGLHDERWWLPRLQSAVGTLRMGFVRSKGTIDQTFRYASVDGFDSLPTPALSTGRPGGDVGDDFSSIGLGAADAFIPGRAFDRDESEVRCSPGDTAAFRQRRGRLRVAVRMPCDTAALVSSPLLPPSIFDAGEEQFGIAEARSLAKDLKLDEYLPGIGSSSSSSSPTTVAYGLERGMLRYNRVEGLSAGILAEREIGRGYLGTAIGRLGLADLQPNVELRISRGRPERATTLGVYRRLDQLDDWGDAFGFGGSISALVFGRDEGHYARSLGADLRGGTAGASWRLFAERQDRADVETNVSLPNLTRDARFRPNVLAEDADQAGGQLRLRFSHGMDPLGFRLLGDLRAEAAAGTFDYSRIAGDFTASRQVLPRLVASVTGGAGTSGGTLSPQRAWRIGGTHTVRGHRPAVRSGDSYWLARAEVGATGYTLRPVAFYDAGWAGDRRAWTEGLGEVRGAGVGVSFLDGLARIDLARGVSPTTAWRMHLYVEATF